MKVFRRLSSRLRPLSEGSVLAIGIFDGCHLGHQKILKELIKQSRRLGVAAGLMTFSPHPDRILNRKKINLIQTGRQKLEYLENQGLDYCLVLSLERDLAALSGQEFASQILKKKLGISRVVVGQNFRFGHNRRCGVRELRVFGRVHGFRVVAVNPVKKGGTQVSSSLIRKLLDKGRVETAARLLGRPYEIYGTIVKGRGLGRILGFPTINLKTENEILPSGVYLSLVKIDDGAYPAVANIGFRPTFNGRQPSVEAHLLDFSGRLYGRKARLYLLKKLRDEKKFHSVEALRRQISADVSRARRLFRAAGRRLSKP
ncbi:MAG: bifunctional riboflavin kinase/FAD synthetase [Candidatus Saccharicenans sp.]|nr:bifunctional riboflavin kinase/FAD synthetase [Candidatus Saccharicenans sp.]